MIDLATARRGLGDWAGACAAAHVDVDLDLRALARTHGRDLAARVRADLRYLAPDLLRWHLPRVAPDGLLRPGLTITLARYATAGTRGGGEGFVHLVVRTAPAWADAGQRVALGLWEGAAASPHPHARPNRRFRLDLHRHLWDARRADELPLRCGAPPGENASAQLPPGCAVDRWAEEAALLLRAEKSTAGMVLVRCGARRRVVLQVGAQVRITEEYRRGAVSALPVLPDAATWALPDLVLLRAGAISVDQLHPLVAAALDPTWSPRAASRKSGGPERPRLVWCRGQWHRIGFVDGRLAALDHDPAEIRREELLVALTGTALPCLQVIDRAHRRPEALTGIRERLDHGDSAGALAEVERLLGPAALLRDGPLRDELESAARRRITYGLFRAGLSAPGRGVPAPAGRPRREDGVRPRHAVKR